MSEGKLLDDIANRIKISYLSDLHIVPRTRLVSELKELVKQDYSPEDWSYALSYMSGEKVVCTTIAEVESILEKCELEHNNVNGL